VKFLPGIFYLLLDLTWGLRQTACQSVLLLCALQKEKDLPLTASVELTVLYNESKHNKYAPRRLRPIKKTLEEKEEAEKVKFPPCELMMSDP
jgi:hypothetical protein